MKSLLHVWFIALKELKLFATDRLALAFAILFPFLFVLLFSFLLSDVGSDDSRLKLHLTTRESAGGISHDIIESMATEEDALLEPGEPVIIRLDDYDTARRMVADKEIDGFLSFPEDFTQSITMGFGAQLEVIADADAINTRAALNGLASGIASRVSSQQVANRTIIELLLEERPGTPSGTGDIGQTIQQFYSDQENMTTAGSQLEYTTEKIGDVEAENPSNFVIPGYLVMFVFFTAALSAERIVRERQNRTLERMLATSVRREAILGGTFLGTAAKGLIQIALFWVVGIVAFKIDLGQSPAATIILSIMVVIMSASFGIMLATLVRTERSAGSIGVLSALVLAPLGGCWWPLFITPSWMQFIAKVTPHGWATTGFNKLMVFGADFNAVVPEMLALIGFAVLFAVIAVWRFRTHAI